MHTYQYAYNLSIKLGRVDKKIGIQLMTLFHLGCYFRLVRKFDKKVATRFHVIYSSKERAGWCATRERNI